MPHSSTEPAVKPGDDGYRVAELPFRHERDEASSYGAKSILNTLETAEGEGVSAASQYAYIPREIVEAWTMRDRGEEPEVTPEDALTRMRYAFSSLPDDVRCDLAAQAERAAWSYVAPDLEHLRIVQERAAEEAEREREEEAERQRQRDADHQAEMRRLEKQRAEQHTRDEGEKRAAEEEEARQRELSEKLRRQSEATRLSGAKAKDVQDASPAR